MTKVKSTPNKRKLTAAGLESCADSLLEKAPYVAAEIGTEKDLLDLNEFLSMVDKSRRIKLLEKHIAASLFTSDTFAEMKSPELQCREVGAAARCLEAKGDVGTMEWTFEVFPELRAHVCEFLLAAEDMENMVRDLTAGYNFIGTESEDVNDILTRSNNLCKKLSLFARVNEKRLRVMAKLGRTSKTRKLNPNNDGGKQAA